MVRSPGLEIRDDVLDEDDAGTNCHLAKVVEFAQVSAIAGWTQKNRFRTLLVASQR